MIPSERRWRGSLRLIKSRLFKIRHSGTALSSEESAALPLQIPRCYVPRHDKTYKFGLRLSTVNLCHSEPALQPAEKVYIETLRRLRGESARWLATPYAAPKRL